MTILKRLISTLGLTALLTLAACGGGGPLVESNTGTGGGSTTPVVSDLALTLSASSIINSGTSTVTATVTALDANRNTVPSAAVTLSANSDAVVTISGTAGSVTNAAGVLQASIGIGSNTTLRTITITATAGSVTKTATLQVINSPTGTSANAIEVIAATPTVGTGGDGVVITAFVKDVNNNALASVPVSFSANTGTLSSVSTSTNSAGAATATFSSGVERSNRTATVTVTSGTISKQLSLQITGTRLTLSGSTALIVGNIANFDVVASDSKGNTINGVAITATSSLGNALSAAAGTTTNSSGQVRYAYTATTAGTDSLVFSGAGATVSPSPALTISSQDFSFISPAASATVDAGKATEVRVRLRSNNVPQTGKAVVFTATSGTLSPSPNAVTSDGTQLACDGSGTLLPAGVACVLITSNSAGPLTLQATTRTSDGSSTSTSLPLVVVAKAPSNITLQVSPAAIPPNTSAASSNVATALARVVDASGNPVQGASVNFTRVLDNSGGNLLQASAITDASGQASVSYRAGGQTTANDGVVLQAALADFPAITPAQAKLTVNQSALFIALGTGNTISNLDPQTYKKDWVVYVTDANGIPVNAVTLTVRAIPSTYITGRLAWNGTSWAYARPSDAAPNVIPPYACVNEDRNLNGVLDAGEDSNNDGLLWPGNVISVTPNSVQTANGVATISLVYAESYAPWVKLQLTASAVVSGTESKTTVEFIVPGVASDFTSLPNPPASVISPFGEVPKNFNGCSVLP